MTEINCYYHPNIEAVTKCEDCGKPICLKCKKIHRETHHAGVGESSSYYATQHDLCGPCYYNTQEKIASSTAGSWICSIVGIVFSIIFIGVGILVFGGLETMMEAISGSELPENSFLDMMPTFMAFVIAIFFILGPAICILAMIYNILTMGGRSNKKLESIRREREHYMANTGIKDTFRNVGGNICGNCGTEVSSYDQYCPGCGKAL